MNESNKKDECLDDVQRFVESQRLETLIKILQPINDKKRCKKVRRNIPASELNILLLCIGLLWDLNSPKLALSRNKNRHSFTSV